MYGLDLAYLVNYANSSIVIIIASVFKGRIMSDKFKDHLENIDENRRKSIKKLLVGGAFIAPLVASFAMKGGVSVALAQAANSS